MFKQGDFLSYLQATQFYNLCIAQTSIIKRMFSRMWVTTECKHRWGEPRHLPQKGISYLKTHFPDFYRTLSFKGHPYNIRKYDVN